MSELNRVVVSRRVLTREGERPAALHLGGGVIRKVAALDDLPPGVPVDDAGDAVVMAGAVDTHVHVNEPGRTEWEGFSTATEAAAAGGVTTVVDMPLNSIPATVSDVPLSTARAMPKSVSTGVPSSRNRMFSGLMSR